MDKSAGLLSLSKKGNLILVIAISAVLCMMIMPLPQFILDSLLATNMIAALTIMLVSISISSSMKLAAFPTMLLMATLFRLGLNISSTRLILSEGQAGRIIETFGYFATGSNLLVGFIMFIILTIIQFVVIAKGSERVAEVAARFTLDALPGKQMSIDADLRAGLLDQNEAKYKRDQLSKESKLFGAMDGALKFVKGDAIAGIIITMVNLVGGILAGVSIHGYSFGDSINTFALLSIGDGLVSQIPALLIAISAGFVVTRVNDEDSEASLGEDIGIQIFSQPKALATTALLALGVGCLPGFPFWIFMFLSIILFGVSFHTLQSARKVLTQPKPVDDFILDQNASAATVVGHTEPFVLEVGPALYEIFRSDDRWLHCFNTLYPQLKNKLSLELGVLFPDIKISINQSLANGNRYNLRLFEVPIDFGMISPHHCSLIGGDEDLQGLKIAQPENTTETVHGTHLVQWQLQQKSQLAQSGVDTFGPEEMLLRHIARVLRKNAGDFIGIQEVRNLLTKVEQNYPELVREVVPKLMSIQKLTEIVKRLVEEEVSIRDFRLILQTLSCLTPDTKDPVTLTEQVRVGLKRAITHRYTHGGNRLKVITLAQDIEEAVRGNIQRNGQECYLAIPPEKMRQMTKAFKALAAQLEKQSQTPVLLTQIDIRRYVRKLVEQDYPELAVLSFQELDSKVMLEQVGEVNFVDDEFDSEESNIQSQEVA